jgi:hypothetical protein
MSAAENLGPQFVSKPSTPYHVVTQHGPERAIRRKKFSTFEEADAYASSTDPDKDGSMAPNVDDKFVHHEKYEKGYFWPKHENRYAVMLKMDKPKERW